MCQTQSGSSSTDQHFTTFCAALRQWLADEPRLDPPLAAARDLLDRRLTWFECEFVHLARNTDDMHSMLGAGALLSLWHAVGTGGFSLR